MFTLSVNIVLIILRSCRYAWKTSWEKSLFLSLFLSLSLSLSVSLFWCHLFTYSRVLTSEVLGGEALPRDSLSHCVSLLSATEKTSPLLMWHCVTRPSRLKNLPLVSGYSVHYHMAACQRDPERDPSESERRENGLCVCVCVCVWEGGVFGEVVVWGLGTTDHCSFWGLVARALIAAWPVGILFCLSQSTREKRRRIRERNHSHPVNLCPAWSYLPSFMHANRGQTWKEAVTVTQTILNCLFFCDTNPWVTNSTFFFFLLSLLHWVAGHTAV